MHGSTSRARRALAAIVTTVTAAALLATAPPTSAAPPAGSPAPRSGLDRHDRELLAGARANGEPTVSLLLAAKPGAGRDVAAGIQSVGGRVLYRDDALGYLRAEVPTGRAEQAARLSGVQTADLNDVLPLDDPRPDGQVAASPYPAPDAGTPRDNPYLPVGETGAAAFTAAHPTWDGRGVTVGILDTGVALDHPALATTTTGAPKVVDWVTYTDPVADQDPTWVPTAPVTGPAFTAAGTSWTSPAGSFRFGVFNERDSRLGGEVGRDVNRDGNPPGSSGVFGVLWDGAAAVRVDVDQDRDFTDEPAMTDYRVNRDVRFFGTDDPATAIAERLPFVVQPDGRTKAVNIGIVSGAHGTHVAGIVAGNGLFGGAMSGAAPGAQLVSVRVCLFIAGCTASALIEGMIYATRQANVDVVNMSIGGLPALNDANNTRAVIYDRLIEQENVQLYISAGNSGPGVNTVGDPSVAGKVMSIGTSISDATWASNYGSTAPADGVDNQHPFSSRGPREDGGFKPNVIAPGAAISTTPVWQPGSPVAGVHALPPGYGMFNGTSMAAPQAAGAGALLVSAAKQAGVQHQPAQLRQALSSSARFFPSSGAYEQGNGLIQVPAAWALLATNAKTVSISSAVSVDTALEQFLATPGIGVGIHDREGVRLGQAYTRTYTFTRTSGAGGAVPYALSLVGNDGTFTLGATSITLPKGQPRTLAVTVNPTAYGVHSAILTLDDVTNPGIEHQTLNTVVVAHELAESEFTQTVSGTVARNEAQSHFFAVPAGARAFTVEFSGPNGASGTGQARFLRFHPYGVGIDSNSSLSCYSPPVSSCSGGTPTSRTVTEPTPGVWELTVEARRTSDADFTPFTLTASLLGVSVAPHPDLIPSATIGVPVSRSYSLTNLLGSFTGRAVGSTLGSALRARPAIADLEQQAREVTVTPGTTSLEATIGNPSDAAADLDLFVYNCTTGTCRLADYDADGDSEESVSVANPAAGRWEVVVDGYAVPAGSTHYDYIDVFTNPAHGSVSLSDTTALRPAGAGWTVPGSVTANDTPAAGRVLLGQVQVRTDSNVLVGSGQVVVQSVG